MENIFSHDAVKVTAVSKAKGMSGIHTYFVYPFLTTITVTSSRATAAINWLAMPKSGNRVWIPPRGSVTPMSSKEPQAATTAAVAPHEPARHDGSLNFGNTFPRASETWNRATRVTASTAERMNRASNMIAKWYQKPIIPDPPPS